MGWFPRWSQTKSVPAIVDEKWGNIAFCLTIQGEPKDHAWSRACVMSMAPEFHAALAELIGHGRHHFPEDLKPELDRFQKLLDKVKEFYDKRN
jgi:hypothetical protein